jgi:hypothetical protein
MQQITSELLEFARVAGVSSRDGRRSTARRGSQPVSTGFTGSIVQ